MMFNLFENKQKKNEKWSEVYDIDPSGYEETRQGVLDILIKSNTLIPRDLTRLQNKRLDEWVTSMIGQNFAKATYQDCKTRLSVAKKHTKEIKKKLDKGLKIIFEGLQKNWGGIIIALLLSLIPGANLGYTVFLITGLPIGFLPTMILYLVFEIIHRKLIVDDLLINWGLHSQHKNANQTNDFFEQMGIIFQKLKIYFGFLTMISIDGAVTYAAIMLRNDYLEKSGFDIFDYSWIGASLLSDFILIFVLYSKIPKGYWLLFREQGKKKVSIYDKYEQYQELTEQLKSWQKEVKELKRDVNQWSHIVSKLGENSNQSRKAFLSEGTVKRNSNFSPQENFPKIFKKESKLIPKEVEEKIDDLFNKNSHDKNNGSNDRYDMT